MNGRRTANEQMVNVCSSHSKRVWVPFERPQKNFGATAEYPDTIVSDSTCAHIFKERDMCRKNLTQVAGYSAVKLKFQMDALLKWYYDENRIFRIKAILKHKKVVSIRRKMLFTILKYLFSFQRYLSFWKMQISQLMKSYTQPK